MLAIFRQGTFQFQKTIVLLLYEIASVDITIRIDHEKWYLFETINLKPVTF